MPEIRLKSQQKQERPTKPPQRRSPKRPIMRDTRPPPVRFDDSGTALRRRALAQLKGIQLNTAGLSCPYPGTAERMERVTGNHAAVRELRVVLRRSLILPRKGPLGEALLAWMLQACGGKVGRAARNLGLTVRQLRRSLGSQPGRLPGSHPHLALVE